MLYCQHINDFTGFTIDEQCKSGGAFKSRINAFEPLKARQFLNLAAIAERKIQLDKFYRLARKIGNDFRNPRFNDHA